MEFVFVAIGVSMIVRSVGAARGMRDRRLPPQPHAPAQLEDPRVPMLQAEVEELRTQVERLSAAESFYAQLSAPAPAPRSAAGSVPPPTPSPAPTGAPTGAPGERPAG
jgi:hypothetical protein